nr:unnamed protein product [Callosobruchus chinensis]
MFSKNRLGTNPSLFLPYFKNQPINSVP